MDSERFDGLARTVAERGTEHARDREQFAALSRLVAAKGSRRVALTGLLGAVLHGVGLQPTAAQCRSKEGKNLRQCRRREREEKAPGAGTRGVGGPADCLVVLQRAGCSLTGPVPQVWSCPGNTNLNRKSLIGCDLTGSQFSGILMNDADLTLADLTGANLNGSQLHGTQLQKANLSGASLIQTNLGGAQMWSVDLSNAVLRGAALNSAYLRFGNLQHADFTGANLPSSNLRFADLRGANFQNADLNDVSWDDATCPDGWDALGNRSGCCNHLNGHTPTRCSAY